jgi:inosine-uridine nucleoside N-ribohydrolase
MTKKMIIDTDVGIDDAVAILMALADPGWEIVGVAGVSGNVGLDHVMRNICTVLDAAGAGDIPVFRGADRPLLARRLHAASVHGDDGLGDVGFPATSRRVEREPAAQALVRLAHEHPGATLIALGPLTNVALAVAIEPDLPNMLGQMVLMGGAVRGMGNASPVAEFNIYADAEAAAMVFERGMNPTVLAWEVTVETPILWPRWDALLETGSIGSRFVAPMIDELARRSRERERPGILMPDPLAMAAVLDPGCATSYTAAVDVDTGAGAARGMTAVDHRRNSDRPHNAWIISTIDTERFAALLERAFRMEYHL